MVFLQEFLRVGSGVEFVLTRRRLFRQTCITKPIGRSEHHPPVNAETFPSQLDRAALQVWHNHFDWHIQTWDLGKQTQGAPASWVAIGPGAAVRPIADLDRSVEAAPDGWNSLGHDPELISEHLQAQSAIHNELVNEAVVEWCGYWRNPTRAFVRPSWTAKRTRIFGYEWRSPET
jgi:hypothetical protein